MDNDCIINENFRNKTCTMNEILRKRAKWVKGWELKLHHGQNSKKRVVNEWKADYICHNDRKFI
jgi:hypothetical protein